jgi:hypothetical protein
MDLRGIARPIRIGAIAGNLPGSVILWRLGFGRLGSIIRIIGVVTLRISGRIVRIFPVVINVGRARSRTLRRIIGLGRRGSGIRLNGNIHWNFLVARVYFRGLRILWNLLQQIRRLFENQRIWLIRVRTGTRRNWKGISFGWHRGGQLRRWSGNLMPIRTAFAVLAASRHKFSAAVNAIQKVPHRNSRERIHRIQMYHRLA